MTSSGVSNASKMGLAISRPVMSRKMPLVTAMIAVVEMRVSKKAKYPLVESDI